MAAYSPLELVKPNDFDDPLVSLIIELDHERKRVLQGSTPPFLFFQLKDLFQLMESLGSARIEGNRTTVAQLADEGPQTDELPLRPELGAPLTEIRNVERAMGFIEEFCDPAREPAPLGHPFIRELHRLVTEGLPADGEGDDRPGSYRQVDVRIARAIHQPPSFVDVQPQMDELLEFLRTPHDAKYDLIKTALAHHRFAWIHPFRNGNGRTVRLLTYALLIRQGFLSGGPRILNPTAVFCSDRDEYYARLADADSLEPEALLRWCRYVLGGLLTELGKIDRLLDFSYLKGSILGPAVKELGRKVVVGPQELIILTKALEHVPLQRSDIEPAVGPISPAQLTRVIADLRNRRYLLPLTEGGRKYVLGFTHNPLLREVLRQLDHHGFLPLKGEV